MPIYAYRCDACGHAQDHLQKMSDPLMTACPACGKPEYKKQLTAAGFQLKGSGWYVTDFRDGGKKDAAKKDGDKKEAGPAADSSKEAGASGASAASGEASASTAAPAAVPAPAPAAAPAPAPASA
jgi:putative FmdB family regulatory protein